MKMSLTLAVFLLLVCSNNTLAGTKSNAAGEAAEYLMKMFGRDVGEKGAKALAEEIAEYGGKYGGDAIAAIRKMGPQAFKMIDDAGENAPAVISLINRHGNKAVYVASKPRILAIFVRHGDDAAKAMIQHPGIAEPVIEKFGVPAATALQKVSGQNARRIAMMSRDGSLEASGDASGLLKIIERHGDRACDWVWRNKGTLAASAVMTAFLANPEPFINGTTDVIKTGSEALVLPIAEVAGKAINWPLYGLISVGLIGAFVVISFGPLRQGYFNKLLKTRAKPE